MRKIKLTWHGHSCFSINNEKWTLIIDPYDGEKIGYPPLRIKAHAMLSSHDHHDHNCRAAVEFLYSPGGVLREIGLAEDWPRLLDTDIYYIKKLSTKHDDANGTKRGSNTIHIINTAGVKLAHFGDLGHALTQEQSSYLTDLDFVLLPVGGYYTIDAEQASAIIRQIKPRNIIPMHYTWQFGSLPITSVEPFIEQISDLYTVEVIEGAELTDIAARNGKCFTFTSIFSEA